MSEPVKLTWWQKFKGLIGTVYILIKAAIRGEKIE